MIGQNILVIQNSALSSIKNLQNYSYILRIQNLVLCPVMNELNESNRYSTHNPFIDYSIPPDLEDAEETEEKQDHDF